MASQTEPRELDRFRLLASAIAGRTLDVAAADAGTPSWTDGRTVFLESGSPVDCIRMLGVQASLVAAGSLDHTVLRQLSRRPAVARRYLAVEGHRALGVNEDILPPIVRSLLDRDVAARVTTPEASLNMARSRLPIDGPSRAFGTIEVRRTLDVMERTERGGRPGTDVQPQSAGTPLEELSDDDDGIADERYLGQLLSSPVGGGGPIGRLLARFLDSVRERGGGGPPGADAPTHVSRSRPGTGSRVAASTSPPGPLGEGPVLGRHGAAYPEWDVRRRCYRPHWCTVLESDPEPAGEMSGVTMRDDLAVRRSLARLGRGLTHVRRQPQGDDVDIDAAVEARVDAVAGRPHDDDVCVESLRRRRDLSVLVLLDVSGSAGESGTAGKAVHEHQRTAAAALTVVLHELGDRVALYGFNSRGRQAVQLLRVKRFADHLDGHVAERLYSLKPAAYTRLGAAIRHGTTVLEEQGGTSRRLLLVLSDGFAYDHGYEGRYGEADARRALTEARRRGVACLCLSVGTDTDAEALRRVFGPTSHAGVPATEQLAGLIGPLFRAALRSAEAQRRAFQRKERAMERLEIERSIDA